MSTSLVVALRTAATATTSCAIVVPDLRVGRSLLLEEQVCGLVVSVVLVGTESNCCTAT